MTFRIRPITSPWKLAGRIALVVLVTCFVCNALLWTVAFLELFGARCEFICPQSVAELLSTIGLFGLGASVVTVPASTILMTPLILMGYEMLKAHMSETLAFLLAIFASLAFLLSIAALLIIATRGVPVSVKPVIDLFPAVFLILGITFSVALILLAIEKTLKTRKKKKV